MIHSLILSSHSTTSYVLACSNDKKLLENIRELLIKSYHRSNLLDNDIPNEIFLPNKVHDLMKDKIEEFIDSSVYLPDNQTLKITSESPLEQSIKDLHESLRKYL